MIMVDRSGVGTWTAMNAAVKAAAVVVHSGAARTRAAVESTMTMMWASKSADGKHCRSNRYYEFFVHFEPSFLFAF